MPNNLICPYCGQYQTNTKLLRQIGVGLKNTAKVVGGFAVKQGAKTVASTVVSNDMALRMVGTAAGNAATEMGLGMKNTQSLSSVQYKCACCGRYWDGLDSFQTLNSLQKRTVSSMLANKKQNEADDFSKKIIRLLYSILISWIAYYVYSSRHSYEEQKSLLSFEYTVTNYSWHYYVMYPLFIVAIVLVSTSIYKLWKYYQIMRLDEETYAQLIMQDNSNV